MSNSSMFFMVYCASVAYGILVGPRFAILYAREAAPLVFLLGLGLAVLLQQLFSRLADRFPRLTIFQWIPRFLGPIGYPLALLLAVYLMTLQVAHSYMFATQVQAMFLTRTPLFVIIAFGFLLAAVGAYLGIEAIARFTQIVTWIELLILPPLILAAPATITWTHFLPWLPPAEPASLLGPFITLASFLGFAHPIFGLRPFLPADRPTSRQGLGGLLFAGLVIWLFVIATLGTFGPDFARYLIFPTFEYSQIIRLPRSLVFLSRYSLFFLTIWVLAILKLAMMDLFAVSLGLQQIFGLRSRLWPLAVLTVVGSMACAFIPNVMAGERLLVYVSAAGVVLAAVVLPLIGLLIWLLRGRADRIARESAAE